MFEATVVSVKQKARSVGKAAKNVTKIHDEEIRDLTVAWCAGVGIGTGISLIALGAIKLGQMALAKED